MAIPHRIAHGRRSRCHPGGSLDAWLLDLILIWTTSLIRFSSHSHYRSHLSIHKHHSQQPNARASHFSPSRLYINPLFASPITHHSHRPTTANLPPNDRGCPPHHHPTPPDTIFSAPHHRRARHVSPLQRPPPAGTARDRRGVAVHVMRLRPWPRPSRARARARAGLPLFVA